MPELVEVETARRVLAPQLNGCTIEDAEVRLAKSIKNYGPEEFKKLVLGSRFDTVLRAGKFLISTCSRRSVKVRQRRSNS